MFSLSEKLYLLIGGRQEDAYRKEATECSYVPSREAFDKVLEDPYPVLKRRIQYCQDVIWLSFPEKLSILQSFHSVFADVQSEDESSDELFRTCCFM